MKKIWIFVALAMVIVMITSAMSHTFDFKKSGYDETSAPTSTQAPVTSDLDSSEYEEGMFYYYDEDGHLMMTDLVSELSVGTDGFYIRDGKTYFASVEFCNSGCRCVIEYSSSVDNYPAYDHCLVFTNDMIDFTDHDVSDTPEYDGKYIVAYCVIDNANDPEICFKFVKENVIYDFYSSDPGEIEGPSAE